MSEQYSLERGMSYPHEFDARVRDAVDAIAASPARRRAMREELLSHLVCGYEEELGGADVSPRAAVVAALRRLGDPGALHEQLQKSVPFVERLVFQFLAPKESRMSRWLYLVATVAFFLGTSIVLPALARHKQQGVPWAGVAPALAIGVIIALAGVVTILYGVVARLRRRTVA